MLPGVYSVIVPLPSVVVVVVVVSETCAQANGAAIARAILNTILFIFFSFCCAAGKYFRERGFLDSRSACGRSCSNRRPPLVRLPSHCRETYRTKRRPDVIS